MLEGEDWYRYYNEEDFEDLSFLYDKIYGDPKLHPYSQWAGYFELNGVPIKIKYKYPYTKHLIEHIHDNYKDFGLEKPKVCLNPKKAVSKAARNIFAPKTVLQ